MGQYEYLQEMKSSFRKAFESNTGDGNNASNIVNSNIATLEKKQDLIIDGLCGLMAMLADKRIVELEKIKDLLKNGYLVKEIKPK